jgi:hypothetical protein
MDRRELFDAIIAGARASKFAAPDGSLETFFKNVCDANISAFMILIGELIQQEAEEEEISVEPQHTEEQRLQ